MATKLSQFLLKYRIVPHATTDVSPAELFLKHLSHTRLDLLKPSMQEHVFNKQFEQKKHHDACSRDHFFPDWSTSIGAEFPRRSKVGAAGRMSVREGPVTYGLEVNGQLRKRHADQLLDQRGHMAKQPETSITGLSDPELPRDPVVCPKIRSGTSAANSETSSEKLDGPFEDSKETSDSMTSNSPLPQRYPQRS